MDRDYNLLLEQNPSLRMALDLSIVAETEAAMTSPSLIAARLINEIGHKEKEHAVVIAFDSGMRIIDLEVISVGSGRAAIMSVNVILRWVLTRSRPAHGFIIAHNHPSGDTKPSSEDRAVTERIQKAADMVELTLFDHIIVGGVKYHSMMENGDMRQTLRQIQSGMTA